MRFVWMLLILLPQWAFAKMPIVLPYEDAGLSKKEAAAFLLDRLAYGARPGDVVRVADLGPEVWVAQQLDGNLPESVLTERLAAFPSLALSAQDMVLMYPRDNVLRNYLRREGVLDFEKMSRDEIREKLKAYRTENNMRPHQELMGRDVPGQKLYRALYGENQLVEVLTAFWFNHFNVAQQDGQARSWILSYERDVIRPNALGSFRDLLGHTAKHPAMLHYLDNAQSQAEPQMDLMSDGGMMAPARPKRGLNENYARELLELHTLGVDGGYTQDDVVAVARAFTGWTVFPVEKKNAERILKQMKRRPRAFVREGHFLFRRGVHDTGEKVILGQVFPAKQGLEDGEQVLDLLATHPSTARFISTKLARWFVADEPSTILVDQLVETFEKTGGNIRALMVTLVESPAFWAEARQRRKMKSPFVFVVGALRGVDADVQNPRVVLRWIDRMGQKVYAALPPTGYADDAKAWANAGALMTRVNFGLGVAVGKVKGVTFDLEKVTGDATGGEALARAYAALLLPERDTDALVRLVVDNMPDIKKRQDVQALAMILGSPDYQYR